MRPEIGVCVYKMSLKNDLEGTCVLVCMCTHLHAYAPRVHYWPAAEASHFPVFIKTWPIKLYLQSIIRTPQINQRQLNQCFPGPVPGPHGPHGHSIFTAGLIHGRLRWSHTLHPLACSWLLDSGVPWSWLWSAVHGGSLLRGVGCDFINSLVEVRHKKMIAMFHFILSGHVGQRWRAPEIYGTSLVQRVAPKIQSQLCAATVLQMSFLLVMLTCGSDTWQWLQTMTHT